MSRWAEAGSFLHIPGSNDIHVVQLDYRSGLTCSVSSVLSRELIAAALFHQVVMNTTPEVHEYWLVCRWAWASSFQEDRTVFTAVALLMPCLGSR